VTTDSEEPDHTHRVLMPVRLTPGTLPDEDEGQEIVNVEKTCGRCGEPCWYNTAQVNPYPHLPEQLICVPCAVLDDDMREEVLGWLISTMQAHDWAEEQ
jgi:hypothetical protein